MKIIFLFLFLSSSYASIPVVGPEGVIGSMTTDQYAETLVTLKDSVDQNLMNSLATNETNLKWKLSQIVFGLGFNGEIGISPYKIGTTLKQRFIYVRNQ